jgi:phage terminase large subunit
MDDKGYVPLFSETELVISPISDFMGNIRMGVDPSGEGQDVTAWLARDNFKMKVLGKEIISNSKTIASKTMTWMTEVHVQDQDIMLDNFGVGADVAKEMALSGSHYNIGTVNVGQPPEDPIYLNLRAEAFFRLKLWVKNGGTIMDNQLGRDLIKELLTIKYRRNESGKIQIMPKLEMKKIGIASPNYADAAMLTFVKPPRTLQQSYQTGGVDPLFPEWGI